MLPASVPVGVLRRSKTKAQREKAKSADRESPMVRSWRRWRVVIGSMLCLLHEYAMQQRKSFVRHSRVKKKREKFKLQFANSVAHCCELVSQQ